MIDLRTDSKRVLPSFFNGVFDTGEEKARRLLKEVLSDGNEREGDVEGKTGITSRSRGDDTVS